MKFERIIRVDLARQTLSLYQGRKLVSSYPVSTAIAGPGEEMGSGCTPRGMHRVKIKIGEDLPENSVFVGRRPTGEVYTVELGKNNPDRDWILTRIIWLTGLEPGHNRGGNQDTLRRFIYIHGCPDSEPMGMPASHGCIRMRNSDLMDLFELVDSDTLVEIVE
jgi:lipoprotein-anchoring transpeptidase ErfK/SrfK